MKVAHENQIDTQTHSFSGVDTLSAQLSNNSYIFGDKSQQYNKKSLMQNQMCENQGKGSFYQNDSKNSQKMNKKTTYLTQTTMNFSLLINQILITEKYHLKVTLGPQCKILITLSPILRTPLQYSATRIKKRLIFF